APAAALYAACLYLTLRILDRERPPWRLFLALGLCLGAAMLAKASAVLLLPPILGALLWKAFIPLPAPASSRRKEVHRNSPQKKRSLLRPAATVDAGSAGWRAWLPRLTVMLAVCL